MCIVLCVGHPDINIREIKDEGSSEQELWKLYEIAYTTVIEPGYFLFDRLQNKSVVRNSPYVRAAFKVRKDFQL